MGGPVFPTAGPRSPSTPTGSGRRGGPARRRWRPARPRLSSRRSARRLCPRPRRAVPPKRDPRGRRAPPCPRVPRPANGWLPRRVRPADTCSWGPFGATLPKAAPRPHPRQPPRGAVAHSTNTTPAQIAISPSSSGTIVSLRAVESLPPLREYPGPRVLSLPGSCRLFAGSCRYRRGMPLRASGAVRTEGGWRGAQQTLDMEVQVGLSGETDPAGDLGDGEVGAEQEFLGPLDAPGDHVAVGRRADGLLEEPGEVIGAHVRRPCDLGEGEIPREVLLHVFDRAPKNLARQPTAGAAVEAAGGPPAERRMLPDNVSRQRVRQGLGVERARGAAGLKLGEEREADLLDQRVANAEPVEDLEALPAQTRLGGHPLKKRRVEVEVQAVGRLLPPTPQGRHARRYDRHLAAHDAGLARAPA